MRTITDIPSMPSSAQVAISQSVGKVERASWAFLVKLLLVANALDPYVTL